MAVGTPLTTSVARAGPDMATIRDVGAFSETISVIVLPVSNSIPLVTLTTMPENFPRHFVALRNPLDTLATTQVARQSRLWPNQFPRGVQPAIQLQGDSGHCGQSCGWHQPF